MRDYISSFWRFNHNLLQQKKRRCNSCSLWSTCYIYNYTCIHPLHLQRHHIYIMYPTHLLINEIRTIVSYRSGAHVFITPRYSNYEAPIRVQLTSHWWNFFSIADEVCLCKRGQFHRQATIITKHQKKRKKKTETEVRLVCALNYTLNCLTGSVKLWTTSWLSKQHGTCTKWRLTVRNVHRLPAEMCSMHAFGVFRLVDRFEWCMIPILICTHSTSEFAIAWHLTDYRIDVVGVADFADKKKRSPEINFHSK